MRINNNVMAFNANRNLGMSNTNLGKSLEKLSSGFRINRAGDDAAGLVISQKLRAEVSGLRQATRNAQDGISFAQTAEGALGEVHNMLGRMRDLSVQAANDTNDVAARTAIKSEIDALAAEVGRIGTDTTFSGAPVFTATALSFQVGSEGTGGQITTTVGLLDNTSLGGSDLTALTVDTSANARTSIEAIDAAIDFVSTSRGALGAVQNRFESTIRNLQVTTENLAASESRIRDTDMASEMVEFTKSQILAQAGTAMLGQANAIPQSVLRLLG
ncbi:MAG: flagellin [Actinomycetia bacterium]|nr:flagellin [Actinomycetes bacterium]MCP4227276.1 flagellin [Actinomycetes bacterium]MCP5035312.1 flagellin [Actinomycetes bacterium]